MRLWSLHPCYLDAAGLVAVWREGLLARAVLCGDTRGYREHPQLERFRSGRRTVALIDTYLAAVCDEADRRGYRFDRGKLGPRRVRRRVSVTREQIAFEWAHLCAKLRRRARRHLRRVGPRRRPAVHPLFRVVAGPRASWERASGRGRG
jgi:hypothetical protein